MAKTTKLATGNAKAAKAGKGEKFAVEQSAFDAAFDAGMAFADCLHATYDGVTAALKPLLAPLSGRATAVAVAQWNEYRRAFVLGMAEARAIDEGSAGRAWTRICDGANWVKPQTAEAKAQAEARRAKAAKEAGEAGEGEAGDAKGDGAETAKGAVQMGLTSMEAHIVQMLRAGKFELAAQAVADMAAAAA